MCNKVKKWIQNIADTWKAYVVVSIFVTLVAKQAAWISDLIFKKTINVILGFVANEYRIDSVVKNCLNTEQSHFYSIACVLLNNVFIIQIYVLLVVFISSMISFNLLNRGLSLSPFKLNNKVMLSQQIKFIISWIVLYSIYNNIMLMCGFSDEIYTWLATMSLSLVFFCMVSTGAYGYSISSKIIPAKPK